MSLAVLLDHDETRNFLQDGDVYGALLGIAKKHELPQERVNEFLDLTDAVLDEQIPLAEIPELLREAFGLDDAKARMLAVDIVGIRILPLEAFFPGVTEQITAWGGDVTKFNGARMQKEGVTADALAKIVTERAGISFSDLLMKRLAFLLEQRVNGQKTDESLRIFFGRSLTLGGMGLAKEQIDALMDAVTDAGTGVRILTDEEMATSILPPPSTALEIPPSHDVAAEVPVIASPIQEERRDGYRIESGMTNNEAPDIQSKKKAEKAKKLQDEAMKTALKDAVDQVLEKARPLLEEAKIPLAIFAEGAEKMLRGLRDRYQTRDILERDYKGKGAVIASLMHILEEAESVYKKAIHLPDFHEKETIEEKKDESDLLEERFATLTKGGEKPAQAVVELTAESIPPESSRDGGQKKVTDIVLGSRLMGPVEQLGTMTLADFRRLSTNPEEAVRKMDALLTALQKTSFEDRIRGILAWRKSPLAKLYLDLINESLNTGVSLAEITARRRAKGHESLGPGETQALAKWNEKTRF